MPVDGYAADHDAKSLRILGKRILEVVAPDIGEAHEAKVLDREEREAEAAATFRMVEDGHGKWHGRFTLPTVQGAMLKKALMAMRPPSTAPAWTDKPQCRVGLRTTGWVRRSWSTSAATRSTDFRTPVG